MEFVMHISAIVKRFVKKKRILTKQKIKGELCDGMTTVLVT